MKRSTPLSIALAAALAGLLYGLPWALMWILGFVPPEFEIETRGPTDTTFVTLDVAELGEEDELEDPLDVEGDGTSEDEEPIDVEEDDEALDEGDEDGTGEAAGEAEEEDEGPEAVAGGGKAGKKRSPRRRRRRSEKCQRPHPHVRTAPDGVVEIDRHFVDKMTRNLKTFMSLGYSRPYREDDVKGWYISGFGCASPVFKAGFRRKDVLLTVNGKKTKTVTGVFLLYLKLKKQSDFEVRLLRRGKERTLRFRVVPS